MNRRAFIVAASALLASPVASAEANATSATKTQEEPWPLWTATVDIDIPQEVYEAASEDYTGEQACFEDCLFDYLSWEFRYTVDGEPVEELPGPNH